VSLNDAGVPSYTIHENAAWDYVPETPSLLELAWESDAICFGSLAQRSPTTRETILAFLNATKPDCLKVFDINLRQAYYDEWIIRESLGRANILKLNEDELTVLQTMFGLEEKENKALKQLIEHFGLNLVALTKGENGALMVSADEEIYQAGLSPKSIVDTVGAGDAFTAAMTIGLLQGHALARLCADANQLASYICSQQGAMPPIPETLMAR